MKFRKCGISGILLSLLLCGLMTAAVFAETTGEIPDSGDASGLVASDAERAPQQPVGGEDLVPVHGDQIADGVYAISVKSSSSMFRIIDASLTVSGGDLRAVLTLSGTGYQKLFMGTGEEAVQAEESSSIPYVEDAEGKYTYTVPVSALNEEIPCAGFSKRKQKWYDHTILFPVDSLPEGALKTGVAEALQTGDPEPVDLKDGTYTADVKLEGGSGKASITTPATLTVQDAQAKARIEWSSPNYDYMIVNGKKYLPVNENGNSEFEIPVPAFDRPISVLADTTAMSRPHEIAYTLTFDRSSVKKGSGLSKPLLIAAVLALAVAGFFFGFGMSRIMLKAGVRGGTGTPEAPESLHGDSEATTFRNGGSDEAVLPDPLVPAAGRTGQAEPSSGRKEESLQDGDRGDGLPVGEDGTQDGRTGDGR